jgi:hypothetical protein
VVRGEVLKTTTMGTIMEDEGGVSSLTHQTILAKPKQNVSGNKNSHDYSRTWIILFGP